MYGWSLVIKLYCSENHSWISVTKLYLWPFKAGTRQLEQRLARYLKRKTVAAAIPLQELQVTTTCESFFLIHEKWNVASLAENWWQVSNTKHVSLPSLMYSFFCNLYQSTLTVFQSVSNYTSVQFSCCNLWMIFTTVYLDDFTSNIQKFIKILVACSLYG